MYVYNNQLATITYSIAGNTDEAFSLMIQQNLCDMSILRLTIINNDIQYRQQTNKSF